MKTALRKKGRAVGVLYSNKISQTKVSVKEKAEKLNVFRLFNKMTRTGIEPMIPP